VRGSIVVNDGLVCTALADRGLGLAYAFEPLIVEHVAAGRLRRVLEPFAPSVPGLFLYYPKRSQRSAPLRSFVETLRELAAEKTTSKKARPR
jgi:DNA-binding transcriptional LysR family regulator